MLDITQVTGTIERAQEAIANVSNTALAVNDAYVKTKNVVEQGRRYYDVFKGWVEKLQEWLEKMDPAITPIKRFWLAISNNNEPKRVIIIILIIAAIIILWKFRNSRSREYHD